MIYYYIMVGFVRMLNKELKETQKINNKRTINLKARFALPTGSHFNIKTILATVCLSFIIFLSIVIGGLGSNTIVVQANSVQSTGVGIYWDQACTNRTLSLKWGSIEAGSSYNLTVFIKNERNSAISLGLNTSNWTPFATSSYMFLNWNYTGQVFKTDEVIPIKLTLTVSPTIIDITDFNFETIITTVG
jgi:hypothetical protein